MTDDDSKFPSELADRFQVRMPPGMRDRIKAAAEANHRSMNAEIVATLEAAYPATEDTLHEFLPDLERAIAEYKKEKSPERRELLQALVDAIAMRAVKNVDWDHPFRGIR